MSEEQPNGDIRTRVRMLERHYERLEDRVDKNAEIKEHVAVLRTEFQAFSAQVLARLDDLEETMDKDVKGLRRVFITLTVSVSGAAITFGITSLVVFGSPG